jgi:hypothetical protein
MDVSAKIDYQMDMIGLNLRCIRDILLREKKAIEAAERGERRTSGTPPPGSPRRRAADAGKEDDG